jgi:methionine-S-sulfoxide reductase
MKNKILLTLIALLLTSGSLFADNSQLKKAYFAGGCFWGVEYYLEKIDGVKSVVSGFMGGHKKNPSYKDVVYTKTGHVETVEVTYDPKVVSYQTLAKNFFEIHDFTQTDGQGPDLGEQYLSVIFYDGETEKSSAYLLINILTAKGYKVATTVQATSEFYSAEDYHQDYYIRHKKEPYCHIYKKIF